MTSNISNYSQNIDTNFPVQGRDNPSQGFRDNFAQIRLAFDIASQEISTLQFKTGNIVTASNTILGGVKIGNGIAVTADGTISVTTASYDLLPATNSVLGGVKIGSGVNVAGDGTISVTPYSLSIASPSILGGVKIGAGISISGDGTISASTATQYTLNTATGSILGGVKIGPGISISGDGTISASTATQYTLNTATGSVLGGVKIGAGIGITSDGTISVTTASYDLQPATNTILGGVKIGANITVGGDGTISVATPYILTTATASILGGVKVGSGLASAGDGTISVSNPLSSRTTVSTSTSLIAAGATTLTNVVGYKSYALLKVNVSNPAWVRIYSDVGSYSADASRSQGADPSPGSGVIAEIITTATNETIIITPGVLGFNNENPVTTIIPIAITNNVGVPSTINVTLTLLKLEA